VIDDRISAPRGLGARSGRHLALFHPAVNPRRTPTMAANAALAASLFRAPWRESP
jgi:hypothetical protein